MKNISILLFFFFITMIQVAAVPCGDVNTSGKIDIVDALLIAQHYVGIKNTVFNTDVAEVSGDGKIDIVDALLTAKFYVGLTEKLSGCKRTETPDPINTSGSGSWNGSPDSPRYPFPQQVDYPYGFQSKAVSDEQVKNHYDKWRKKYIKPCNGNLMTTVNDGTTVLVEAMGFAMIAAAYMGDKELVDGLYGFYMTKVFKGGCGMMGWRLSCTGTSGGTATDGDIDVACGLLVAHWQWPALGYDKKLRGILDNAKVLITKCNGVYSIAPGCSNGRPYGGCHETDISYYQPAFFRYFAKISGNQDWAKLADDSNKVRNAAAHPVTGLVPDWQTVDGSKYKGSRNTTYKYDAIRTAFKTGLDYLWNGTPAVKDWCAKLTNWFSKNVGIKKITDGYSLDGKQISPNHNLAHLGSLSVCACANSQAMADAYALEAGSLSDNYWYGDYLGNLYLIVISGNMWNPELVK